MQPFCKLERQYSCANLLDETLLNQLPPYIEKLLLWISEDNALLAKIEAMGFDIDKITNNQGIDEYNEFKNFIYSMGNEVGFTNTRKIECNICNYSWLKGYIDDIYFQYIQRRTE